VIEVARWMGHAPEVTLRTYGHVMSELSGLGHVDADALIVDARRSPLELVA
jgi:hypothetical protein